MGKSAPKAPDPYQTAAAQTQSNKETAITNAELSRINQQTPYGSLNYNIDGYYPDGTPKYSQSVDLSPVGQQLLDLTQQGQLSYGNTAVNSLQNLQNTYSKPFNPGDFGADIGQAQNAAYKAQTQFLDPQYQIGGQNLDANLRAQGLVPGDEAYDHQMQLFNNQKQQAYQGAQYAAVGAGNQQQQNLFNQAAYQYNLPLNTTSALLNGSQVQNPNFQGVPTVNQAGTDYGGIVNGGYQNQLAAFNANQQGMNNLFGLGGSLGAAAILASDRRLKFDIRKVGKLANGIPTYLFRYKKDPLQVHFGVMADEVEPVIPKAVVYDKNGYAAVNYSMLGAA